VVTLNRDGEISWKERGRNWTGDTIVGVKSIIRWCGKPWKYQWSKYRRLTSGLHSSPKSVRRGEIGVGATSQHTKSDNPRKSHAPESQWVTVSVLWRDQAAEDWEFTCTVAVSGHFEKNGFNIGSGKKAWLEMDEEGMGKIKKKKYRKSVQIIPFWVFRHRSFSLLNLKILLHS
jgi:hypothetical protein